MEKRGEERRRFIQVGILGFVVFFKEELAEEEVRMIWGGGRDG